MQYAFIATASNSLSLSPSLSLGIDELTDSHTFIQTHQLDASAIDCSFFLCNLWCQQSPAVDRGHCSHHLSMSILIVKEEEGGRERKGRDGRRGEWFKCNNIVSQNFLTTS